MRQIKIVRPGKRAKNIFFLQKTEYFIVLIDKQKF